MFDRRDWTDVFLDIYKETKIYADTIAKIDRKHSVYLDEVYDAMTDPQLVVRKNRRPSPHQGSITGQPYDVFCRTSNNRLLKVIGLLFSNTGHFLVITVINNEIDEDDYDYYLERWEALYGEEQ